MKKALLALVILVFAGSVVSANPQIQSKHKNMKQGAKSINCNFCHSDAKVPRAKGSYGTAKVDSNRLCRGSGCHPRR